MDEYTDRSGTTGDPRADTAAIRADIEQTRERMSETLDGIGERLNPQRIRAQVRENLLEKKEQVKGSLRDATIGRVEHMAHNASDRVSETRRGLVDTIRDNPIPSAMIGIGMGWLLYNGRRDDEFTGREMVYRPAPAALPHRDGYAAAHDGSGTMERGGGPMGDGASGVRDRAEELTGRAQETASDFAEHTRERASEMRDRATGAIDDTAARARSAASDVARRTRQQTHRLEDRFHDAIAESPLVVGAAAVALGITAGLAVPSTRREGELMGPRREALLSRAREAADETTDKIRHVAERVMDEAKSTAHEAADDIRSTARDAAREEGLMSGSGASSGASSGSSPDTARSPMGASGSTGTNPHPGTMGDRPDTLAGGTSPTSRSTGDPRRI